MMITLQAPVVTAHRILSPKGKIYFPQDDAVMKLDARFTRYAVHFCTISLYWVYHILGNCIITTLFWLFFNCFRESVGYFRCPIATETSCSWRHPYSPAQDSFMQDLVYYIWLEAVNIVGQASYHTTIHTHTIGIPSYVHMDRLMAICKLRLRNIYFCDAKHDDDQHFSHNSIYPSSWWSS